MEPLRVKARGKRARRRDERKQCRADLRLFHVSKRLFRRLHRIYEFLPHSVRRIGHGKADRHRIKLRTALRAEHQRERLRERTAVLRRVNERKTSVLLRGIHVARFHTFRQLGLRIGYGFRVKIRKQHERADVSAHRRAGHGERSAGTHLFFLCCECEQRLRLFCHGRNTRCKKKQESTQKKPRAKVVLLHSAPPANHFYIAFSIETIEHTVNKL